MGPGPSDVAPEVLRAMAQPTIGHLDPAFLTMMDELRAMLRLHFGTKNELTFPVSGTGSAGMEACFVNLLEPGDRALICRHGVFGTRMAEVAKRCGAEVVCVDAPWGEPLDPDVVAEAAKDGPFRILALVHAETSTGVLQDLRPFRCIAEAAGALLVADCVTSFAGLPIDLDAHGVDAAYAGTQKCLSCPPGLSPVSFSARAVDRIRNRTQPVQSWYLDAGLLADYWGEARAYHHTAPINLLYGLHEALRLGLEEGLSERFARHQTHAASLRTGLLALGLELPVAEAHRLDPLTLVRLPERIQPQEAELRRRLLHDEGLEIGGGLGAFAGKAWRIGLMGASCTNTHVERCLDALASLPELRR